MNVSRRSFFGISLGGAVSAPAVPQMLQDAVARVAASVNAKPLVSTITKGKELADKISTIHDKAAAGEDITQYINNAKISRVINRYISDMEQAHYLDRATHVHASIDCLKSVSATAKLRMNKERALRETRERASVKSFLYSLAESAHKPSSFVKTLFEFIPTTEKDRKAAQFELAEKSFRLEDGDDTTTQI